MLLQTALDKADEAQKEMESIPEAPALQEQRTGPGASSSRLQQHLTYNAPAPCRLCCACNTCFTGNDKTERRLLHKRMRFGEWTGLPAMG